MTEGTLPNINFPNEPSAFLKKMGDAGVCSFSSHPGLYCDENHWGGGGEEGDWGLGTHVLWGRSGGRHFNVHSLMQSPDKLNSAVAFRQF